MIWTLHEGSCTHKRTGLAMLPDRSVDHFMMDPPFSKHTHEAQRTGAKLPDGVEEREPYPGGRTGKACTNRARDLGFAHLSVRTRRYVAWQMSRLLERWATIFTDDRGIAGWCNDLESFGLNVVRTGAWVKKGSTPQFSGDRPAQGIEFIVIAHQKLKKGRMQWNRGGGHGVWYAERVAPFWEEPIVLNRGDSGEKRVHTTQKPLELMKSLVGDFTDPGELICDPFAGSGTTGVAAVHMGREFVGWELDSEYLRIARSRLGETREQLALAI